MTLDIPNVHLFVDGREVEEAEFTLSHDALESDLDWSTIAQYFRGAQSIECWIDGKRAVPSMFTNGVSPTVGIERLNDRSRIPISFEIPC